MKELALKLQSVKGLQKLAAITCSIALRHSGNPTAGELKCFAGSKAGHPMPTTEPECQAAVDEDGAMVK